MRENLYLNTLFFALLIYWINRSFWKDTATLSFYVSWCTILNSANYKMTIWSSIWLILIASLLICLYTLIIRRSFLCVYTCSLSVHCLCTQASESMEKSEKQIKSIWTFSITPTVSQSLSSICQLLYYYLSFTCLFVALLPLFEGAGFLPRLCCVL